jgi:hypothetical protein
MNLKWAIYDSRFAPAGKAMRQETSAMVAGNWPGRGHLANDPRASFLAHGKKKTCPVCSGGEKILASSLWIWHDRMGELEKAADLPAPVKAEIEQFFLSVTST